MNKRMKKADAPSRCDADFKSALNALTRAAKRARETARMSKTPMVVWKDGRVQTLRLKTNGKA